MARIGIVTFSDSLNYGAVLQSAALAQTLVNLGHEPEIIDYRRADASTTSSASLRGRARRAASTNLNRLLVGPQRQQRTQAFRDSAITMSPLTYRGDELRANPPDYDAFITGSDQVWNLEHTHSDKTYLLDFVPEGRTRLSYAASFGYDTVRPSDEGTLRDLLPAFDAISVREDSGVRIVERVVGREASLVLDPTLLLTGQQWARYAAGPQRPGRYVLEYVMPGHGPTQRAMRKFSRDLAKSRDAKLVVVGDRPHRALAKWEDNELNAGPREFLALFAGADAVVTNSFHGTAFAVLNEKPFVSVYRQAANEPTARSGRQRSLLTLLGLQQRGLATEDSPDASARLLANFDLDYAPVLTLLAQQREESLQFLRSAI